MVVVDGECGGSDGVEPPPETSGSIEERVDKLTDGLPSLEARATRGRSRRSSGGTGTGDGKGTGTTSGSNAVDELAIALPPWEDVMAIVTRRSLRLQRHAVAPTLLRPGWKWTGEWSAPCVATWPPPPERRKESEPQQPQIECLPPASAPAAAAEATTAAAAAPPAMTMIVPPIDEKGRSLFSQAAAAALRGDD